MMWGFESLKDVLNIIIIPLVLTLIALLWPTIQSAYRRQNFSKLIVRELEEISPFPETKALGESWVDHQKKNFVHRKIFEEPSQNCDFILSLEPDLVYNVSQLWDARKNEDGAQWLWHLEQLALWHNNGDITEALEKWRKLIDRN